MNRRMRILRNVGIAVGAFLVLAVVATILVVRSGRFREYVRQRIVTATEDGTGGRVEVGAFSFDWTHLSAVVTNFVIHGNEPAGAAPYLRADRVEVHLRLFTSFKRLLAINYLGVQHPQANILVSADGSTNVPRPRQPSSSQTTPLQTVVDLAVGHFALTNGSITFDSRKQDFDLRGESLHVQLWYDLVKQGYRGEIALAPLYVVSGRNTPVKFLVTLPVTLGAGRIAFQNGRITTDRSQLQIDASLENLSDPQISAHIRGHVALADVKNAANLQVALNGRGIPLIIDMDVNASAGDNGIDVAPSWVAFGESRIDATGKLRDAAGNGALQFQSHFSAGELGRLAKLEIRPEGVIQLDGAARMDSQRNYDVLANLNATGLSFQQGAQRVRNVAIASAAHLTPHKLDLNGFQIDAMGAEIAGNASLEDFARYSVNGDLRHLDLQTLMRDLGQNGPAYTGSVSGPLSATGDLKAAGSRSLEANARFTIAPGHRGVPVSGRIYAAYRGDTDNLSVTDSYIALPHSRLTIAGSLGNRLSVALTTRDLRDFSPVMGAAPPIVLAGGRATFAGVLTGRLTSPQITGHLAIDRFAAQGHQFDSLAGDLAVSGSRAAITDASLERGAMRAQFSGSVGLQNWQLTQNQPVSLQASVRNGDLADVMALSGISPAGYSGSLAAGINVTGTTGNPRGAANLTLTNATIHPPLDSLQAHVILADQLVTVSNAQVVAGQSHVDLTAEFHHPRDRFNRGQLHVHVESSQVDLSHLQTVQNLRPQTAGILQATADINGELRDSNPAGHIEFQLTNVTADASGRGLQFEGQNYGDFSGTARTNGQAVTYNVSSNFAGSRIRVDGNTELASGYRTSANANIAGLPVERMLVLLKRTDIPVKGSLTATVHFAGTVDRPEGNLDAMMDRGVLYGEPVDRIRVHLTYAANSVDVSQLELQAGNSNLEATAHYDHPVGRLDSGDLQFRIASAHVDLAHLRYVQALRPGLSGALQLTASGAATVRAGEPGILAREVNLNLDGKAIALQGKKFGDISLTAKTSAGQVSFALDSSLAGASVQGRGKAQLSGDYPAQAQLTFHNVTWKGLEPLLGSAAGFQDFDAATDGQITVNGPALRTNALTGGLQLSRFQVTASATGPRKQTVTVENQGPVVVALDRGTARIESLHLVGPQTDVQAHGTVSFANQTMEVSVNAHTDLSLVGRFRRDVVSSGQLTADATVRGAFAKPLINGTLQLHDASVNVVDVAAGLANANGTVAFNGTNASFQNLTGEVGGGKVTLSGFVSYSDIVRLGLRVNGANVRLRLQPGVSAVADAELRLSGRTDASSLSGTVTIDQVSYAPQSDFGAILSRAAPVVQAPATPSPLLDNMKLDIQVRTSSATALQASGAQNLQADANLHIQGRASQPGVTGRITISQGQLVFFNSRYTVNSGSISFFNPIRIDPVLDLSLQTQAAGVDVTLQVTGPIDNMKLSYTSNPPLQFQEIVGLLAGGQMPTSDPTLLANQPPQPPQTFEQMGESALLDQALADPVSSRLQRVFGVTQFKIDPTFSGSSGLPQAQFTLQQQVTKSLTLTYSSDLEQPDAQTVSGNLMLSPQWSAIAARDPYGNFSIRLLYKKQFH